MVTPRTCSIGFQATVLYKQASNQHSIPLAAHPSHTLHIINESEWSSYLTKKNGRLNHLEAPSSKQSDYEITTTFNYRTHPILIAKFNFWYHCTFCYYWAIAVPTLQMKHQIGNIDRNLSTVWFSSIHAEWSKLPTETPLDRPTKEFWIPIKCI